MCDYLVDIYGWYKRSLSSPLGGVAVKDSAGLWLVWLEEIRVNVAF